MTHGNRHVQLLLGAGTDYINWNRQLELSTTGTGARTGTVTYRIVTTTGTTDN